MTEISSAYNSINKAQQTMQQQTLVQSLVSMAKEKTQTRMSRLADLSSDVLKIVGVLQEVASQTKLLSLNAAIEVSEGLNAALKLNEDNSNHR